MKERRLSLFLFGFSRAGISAISWSNLIGYVLHLGVGHHTSMIFPTVCPQRKVQITDQVCVSQKLFHSRLLVDIQRGVYYQKCHDPDCKAVDFKSEGNF